MSECLFECFFDDFRDRFISNLASITNFYDDDYFDGVSETDKKEAYDETIDELKMDIEITDNQIKLFEPVFLKIIESVDLYEDCENF